MNNVWCDVVMTVRMSDGWISCNSVVCMNQAYCRMMMINDSNDYNEWNNNKCFFREQHMVEYND